MSLHGFLGTRLLSAFWIFPFFYCKDWLLLLSSPEHRVLKVSFCGNPLSVARLSVRPCIRQQFLYTTSPLKPLIGFLPNFTGMIPGWSSTKVVQTVPVGCISRSWGKKNANFKNLLV